MNKPTLKVLHKQPVVIRFVSRCPDSFADKIAVKVKRQAFIENQWQDQGVLGANKKHCAQYHTQSYHRTIDGHCYRLIVVKTSAGRARVDKVLKKSEEELNELFAAQEKRKFACEADAKAAKKELEAKLRSSYHQVQWTIDKDARTKRPRGNPGKKPKPPVVEIIWKIRGVIVGVVAEKVEKLRQKDESFVLITNIKNEDKSDREVLEEYKRQYVVEVQFHLLKQPAVASPLFLKKPERIQALLMLLAVALLVRALIQHQVRHRVKSYREKPKIGLNKARMESPTAEAILKEIRVHSIHRKKDEAWCPCYDENMLYQFQTWVDLLDLRFGE